MHAFLFIFFCLYRGGSTWRPHVQPTGHLPQPNSPYLQTVTKTSLAHKQQDSQHIGCGYNNAAKPFVSTSYCKLLSGKSKKLQNFPAHDLIPLQRRSKQNQFLCYTNSIFITLIRFALMVKIKKKLFKLLSGPFLCLPTGLLILFTLPFACAFAVARVQAFGKHNHVNQLWLPKSVNNLLFFLIFLFLFSVFKRV